MTHEAIEARGMVEAYVRRQLAAEDNAAFERHYFHCDQCFAAVEEMEKFVAGMKQAGRRGLLDSKPATSPGWLMPAFAFALAATLVLATGVGYYALIRLPDREAKLEQALAEGRKTAERAAQLSERAALEAAPQANIPVLILTAERAADSANQFHIDTNTRNALLWIDVPPQPAGTKFDLSIASVDDRFSKHVRGLERNPNGALAVSLPVSELPAGKYVVRLYMQTAPAKLVAEYGVAMTR